MTNSKKRIIFAITSLVLLFIMIIGISYAYYAANVKGNTSENPSLKLKSGYLSIQYDGGTSKITGGSSTDTTTDLVYTKDFTITNDGVAESYFGVWIKDYKVVDSEGTETTLSRPEDWTYELKSGDTIIKRGTFPTQNEAIITAFPLTVNETKSLTLTVTYDYITAEEGGIDQSADMQKILSFNVNVTQALDNLESAKEGTLLAVIRDNSNYIESNNLGITEYTSIPGQSASLENEAILSSTEDDYGISYYYRGNVTNNYVNYSEMCWRIVRVQGDGTIKLVLADENGECNADTYSTDNNSSAFINNAEVTVYSQGGYFTNVFENSYIPEKLELWKKRDMKELDTQNLVFTEWCDDSSIITDNSYGYDDNEKIVYDKESATLVWFHQYQYGPYNRLNQPSMKCNFKGLNNSQSTRYISNIGLLTSDEVIFAGGDGNQASSINYNYYLMTNSIGHAYWTMSVHDYTASDNFYAIFGVNKTGYLSERPATYSNNGWETSIRPSIVLKRDVLATTNSDTNTYGQPGTFSNPYVIQ